MPEYDDTRCRAHPQTCAEVQARTPTVFHFCDFCLYGPPEEPTRADRDAIGPAEAEQRIAATEERRGAALREAVLKIVGGPEHE